MRKIISLVLCVAMLISSVNVVFADEKEEEVYNVVSVEFSDNIGNLETLQVMVKDENVYANAEELVVRLGYDVSISDEYVSVYNKEASGNIPYGLTVFYYDSTTVSHMLFTQMVDTYEAPFETIRNEKGVWIPLEYSLLLLNSSMLIVENTILIDMPSKNVIDIYVDILKNNQTYLFDWQDDIGLSEENEDTMGKASFVVTMFNGLLYGDGDSWVQFIQNFALDSSAYDSKYGEELARLFCTYSDNELKKETEKMQELMSRFTGEGALGKAINEIDTELDKNIEGLLDTSTQLKAQIDADNSAGIAAYNKSYQAFENACDTADFFSDATELYTKVGQGVSEATSFLDKFYKVAEVVGFASEFQNQDKFAVTALEKFVEESDSQSAMSKTMKESIVQYMGILQTDIVAYSALRWLEENYDDKIFDKLELTSSLGLPANLMLIGWDVMSKNIPFYKDGLSYTDSFMLSMYAKIFQADAFSSYQTLRNTIFNDVNNITPKNLYEMSQYCYTYLKSCYITRNAAMGSLGEETKKTIPNVIEYQNSINEEIAGYLVQLKNVDTTNESKCYGFLPEDNEEYLEKYKCEKLLSVIGSAETVSFERIYENSLEFAIIKGIDSNGNVVWEYKTEKYEAAQLDRVTEIGVNDDKYYFIEDDTIIALKISDGTKIWENNEFEGGGSDFKFSNDGTLYICGYFSPDFFAVDQKGNTIAKIINFNSEYYWPYKIEIVGGYAEITMEGTPTGQETVFVVDLKDFTYKKKEQSTNSALSNEQLCELARRYYEKVTSSPAPSNIQVDSENGDMVMIHLYQDFEDHIATMNWYTVNRYTGEGTNIVGEYINLLEYD